MNEQRVARVRAEMQAHGLTQMIISDSKSIWYLTGASVEPYERLMALYLPVQGEPVIFLNKLFFVPQAPCRYAGSAGFRLRGCLPRREGCRRTDADEGSIPHQR